VANIPSRSFFRRVSFMIIAAGPPLMRYYWCSARSAGWFRLNMFLNVMTPLIMVISFSDSMQLTSPRATGCSRAKAKSGAE
jgi:hypothetical protein